MSIMLQNTRRRERTRSKSNVGTAARGCRAERSSAALWDRFRFQKKKQKTFVVGFPIGLQSVIRRASIARTAEGGCPHIFRGISQVEVPELGGINTPVPVKISFRFRFPSVCCEKSCIEC